MVQNWAEYMKNPKFKTDTYHYILQVFIVIHKKMPVPTLPDPSVQPLESHLRGGGPPADKLKLFFHPSYIFPLTFL